MSKYCLQYKKKSTDKYRLGQHHLRHSGPPWRLQRSQPRMERTLRRKEKLSRAGAAGAAGDTYDLMLKNEPWKTTWPTCRKMVKIIGLTYRIQNIGPLDTLVIDNKLLTLSDREVIACDLADLEWQARRMGTSQDIMG